MGRVASLSGALALALGALLVPLGGLPVPASAQDQPGTPHVPPMLRAPSRVMPRLPCGPGNTRPECQARRQTLQPTLPLRLRSLKLHEDDVLERRFIPPKIMAFLDDPRISPETRAFLLAMAAKPTGDWTLSQAQMVMQLVPTLTELHIPTIVLSEFYDFLGLDPTELFQPQLGKSWQQQSTALDKNDIAAVEQAQCFALLGYGEIPDPTQVTLNAIAACSVAGKR